MQIVIDIPDYDYRQIKEYYEKNDTVEATYSYIYHGTPLPKGHGRLIDAREYENSIRRHYFDSSTVIRCTKIALDNAQTIIEADKGDTE